MSDEVTVNVKKQFVGAIFVLAGICLASGFGMALVYGGLEGAIEENQQQAFNDRLAKVMGEGLEAQLLAQGDEKVVLEPVYYAVDGDELVLAAAGKAQGYQSTINVIVAVEVPAGGFDAADPSTWPDVSGEDLTIRSMGVVSSQETPGLGENIKAVRKDVSLWGRLAGQKEAADKRPAFQAQFAGIKAGDIGKDAGELGQIDAITGATISSKATTDAVRDALANLRKTVQTARNTPNTP